MKSVFKIASAAIIIALVNVNGAYAQNVNTQSSNVLSVQLSGLETEDGTIYGCVATKEKFDKFQCDYVTMAAVADINNDTIAFNNVPNGQYGVRLYHDLNGNNKLDTNFMGIPTEPWAVSNNAKGNFGPPKYEDAAVTVNGATTIKITIQ